jgi:hypothetical protein
MPNETGLVAGAVSLIESSACAKQTTGAQQTINNTARHRRDLRRGTASAAGVDLDGFPPGIAPHDAHGAAIRVQQPQRQPQQRRFTGAVAADETDHFTPTHLQAQARQCTPPGERAMHVIETQH